MGENSGDQPKSIKQRHLISLRKQAEETGKAWIDIVLEQNPDALPADGFESCIIGLVQRFGWEPIIAYDYDKCVNLLMQRDGMSYEEAVEFMEFNVTGAWVGEGTPAFISTVQ